MKEEAQRVQCQIFITRYPSGPWHVELAVRKNMDSMEGVLKAELSRTRFEHWFNELLAGQVTAVLEGPIHDLWGDVLANPTLDGFGYGASVEEDRQRIW